jgi:flagellar FliJ protein
MSYSSQAMHLLLKLAKRELDIAAEQLAKAHRTANESKAQKEQLLFYREEYVVKNAVRLSQGMAVVDLQNFQAFLDSIDSAIKTQEIVIEQYLEVVKQHMKFWQACEAKKRKYEILIEKNKKEKLALELKSDQKLMDEFAITHRQFHTTVFH